MLVLLLLVRLRLVQLQLLLSRLLGWRGRRRRRPAGGSAAGAEGWRREEPWEVLLSALYVPDAPPAAAQPLLLTGPAE